MALGWGWVGSACVGFGLEFDSALFCYNGEEDGTKENVATTPCGKSTSCSFVTVVVIDSNKRWRRFGGDRKQRKRGDKAGRGGRQNGLPVC